MAGTGHILSGQMLLPGHDKSTQYELREPERPMNKNDFYQSLKRFQNSGENVQDENHIGGQLLR